MKKVIVTRELECPAPPNFIRYSDMSGAVPVEDLTEDELKQIGEVWTENLINHAKKQRERNK